MPARLEGALRRRALALQRAGKLRGDPDAYVYGTMRKVEQSHHHSPHPKGEELRTHWTEVHGRALSYGGTLPESTDARLEERHSREHASMAISTPERMREGQHHRAVSS